MSACNARPPEGHPFHGTLVACHLPTEHVELGEPHSWDIDAAVARAELVNRAMAKLREHFPERAIQRVDTQLPRPLYVYSVDPETGERAGQPYRQWDLPHGPWVIVTLDNGREFGIWKATGAVFPIGADGAVEEDPL